MIVVLGVGNSLRGDDGVGPVVAEIIVNLKLSEVIAYNCGMTPENFTGVVRRARPELLVIVDAAEMGLTAGSIRRIPAERIRDTAIGTHMLALSHLVRFLTDVVDQVVFVGVQPACLWEGEGLNEEVEKGAWNIVRAICQDDVTRIVELEKS
jgi:hydrogenase 3 maturation protease